LALRSTVSWVIAGCTAAFVAAALVVGSGALSTAKAAGGGGTANALPDLDPADVAALNGFHMTVTPLSEATVPPKVTETMLQASHMAYWTSLKPSSITYDYVRFTDPYLTAKLLTPEILSGDPALAGMPYVSGLPVWMVSLHGVAPKPLGHPAGGTSSNPQITNEHFMYDAYSGQWLLTWTH
jgi:hypothetical protein